MSDKIIAKAETVATIFADTYRLVLPYFQRGYAWQEAHAARLLKDIRDIATRKGEIDWYPLGSIIVVQKPPDSHTWVADGHQRLITLTILIAILRDLEGDGALKARLEACIVGRDADGRPAFRLTTLEAAEQCLQVYVQMAGATARPLDEADASISESENNIIANRDYLRGEVEGMGAEERRTLARFLLDGCVILVQAVDDQKVARLLFSTMHDTGLKPSPADLFKAQVLGRVLPDARDNCQTIWERLEAKLGRDGFDELLRHIAAIGPGKMPRQPAPLVLRSHFDLDEATAAQSFVERPLRTGGDHLVQVLAAQTQAGAFEEAASRRLQYLGWIRTHDTWMMPVLRWLEFNEPGDPRTTRFLQRLEALAWMQAIRAQEPARRDDRYLNLVKEIREGREPEECRTLEVTAADWQHVRSQLSVGLYARRRYRHFLLLRINASLEGDQGVRHLPDATMEHVFPLKPAAGSRWLSDFRSAKDLPLRHVLGNFTLLTEAEQNAVRNFDFDAKRPVLAASAFALSRQLAQSPQWGPKDIVRNTKDMIDTLLASWGAARR